MRKVILYIAVSLDGYIADARGGVDWLGGQSADYTGDYGYEDFTAQVDTVIMGGSITTGPAIITLGPTQTLFFR